MRAVLLAVFGEDLVAIAHLARDASAEVVAKFVLALLQEISAEWKAEIEARSPPIVEGVTGRTRNGGGTRELARTSEKAWPGQKIGGVTFGDGKTELRIEGQSVNMTAGTRSLRQLQSGRAQWQIDELKIQA